MTAASLAPAIFRFLARSHLVASPDIFVETLTKEIGCDGGELWMMHDDARLRLAGAWYADDINAMALLDSALALACRAGEGLPGRAATAKGVLWIDTIDPATTSRAREFAEAGISSAVAVPMLARGAVSGVLVFLSRGNELPAQPLLDQLSDIASVSALVLESCKATTAAAEARAQRASAVETMKAMEQHAAMLRDVAHAVEASGPAVFDVLARELAHALGTDSAVIAAIQPGDRVHRLGGWSDGRPVPPIVSNVSPAVAEIIATRGGVTGTAGARCTDPTVLELEVEGFAAWPLLDSGGNAIGIAAALSRNALALSAEQDAALRIIAGRAAAELERLRLREESDAAGEHRRLLAESLDDAVITIDDQGVIESVNDATLRIFGYTRRELVGANLSLLMPEPHAGQHDDYLRRYLAAGKAEDLTVRRDVTGRRKDGSLLPLRLSVHEVRLSPRRLFTGVLRDLSEVVEMRQDLQRSRTVIADTQRLTHIGNWVWDLRTDHMEWSDEVFRIFGRSQTDFVPTYPALLSCIHPEDRPAVQSAVDGALKERRSDSVEHRVVRPDGSEVTVHARGEVQLEDGQPVRVIGTVQDVTDRRHSDERLGRLSSAIEQTADQVMITDRNGRIEYVNAAFEQATGYAREAVVGQTPRILKSGQHTLAFYKNVWTTLLDGDVYRGVFVNRRVDGTIMYEDKTIAPIRRADGTITHFVSAGRDIGERMRVEKEQEELRRALALSATEWRLTFDAIEFPLFVCGADATVRRANAAAQKLSGIPFPELIGKRLDELPRCEPWIGAAEMVARVAAGESVTTQVQEPVSRRTWELAAMPFDGDATESLVIFVARDLTDLLELQESLRGTEVMSTLGALVAGVAHEVRNPLFAISATIDVFEGRALDQSLFDQFTARLRVELGRLTELMSDLLEYGRPTDPELRPGTLRRVIDEALHSTAALAASLGVTVDASMDGSDAAVMIDEHRLAIALRNLLDNALRHSARGGSVTLHVVRRDDWVDILVRDDGPGFAPDDLPHLFEPFFTRRRGGTGLGLSIVHRTIALHGGSIVAENHPEGGALMRVRLPLSEYDS